MFEIRDLSDFTFAEVDDANIPVNIFITKVEAGEDDPGLVAGEWYAFADLFMPRKMACVERVFRATCPDRDTLVAYVQRHVRPLYEAALACIDGLDKQDKWGTSRLYYWKQKD